MNLTPTGRAALDQYLANVRLAVGGRTDVDVRDVEAGIVEHVETELAVRAIELASSEDVCDVLGRLGSPAAFDDGERTAVGAPSAMSRGATMLALVLAAAGFGMIASNMPVPGWLALLLATVVARVLIESAPDRGPEYRALTIYWHIAAATAAAVLLLGPAVLVWGAAQIGGVLERPLAARADVTGVGRPLAYWLATAQAAGAATGICWSLYGLLLMRLRPELLRWLGPARRLVPAGSSQVLIASGVSLFILTMIGWLI